MLEVSFFDFFPHFFRLFSWLKAYWSTLSVSETKFFWQIQKQKFIIWSKWNHCFYIYLLCFTSLFSFSLKHRTRKQAAFIEITLQSTHQSIAWNLKWISESFYRNDPVCTASIAVGKSFWLQVPRFDWDFLYCFGILKTGKKHF